MKIEPDGRVWPTLVPPADQVRTLQAMLEIREAELLASRAELVDLHNTRSQHVLEMQIAHEAIEELNKAVDVLQTALVEQERTSATARDLLAAKSGERSSLEAELVKSKAELNRIRHERYILGELNKDKEAKLVEQENEIQQLRSRSEKDRKVFKQLKSELNEAVRNVELEKEKLRAADDGYRSELHKRQGRFTAQLKDLYTTILQKEAQLQKLSSASTELISWCDGLGGQIQSLNSSNHMLEERLKIRMGEIEILESVLKVERSEAHSAMQRLTAELAKTKPGSYGT